MSYDKIELDDWMEEETKMEYLYLLLAVFMLIVGATVSLVTYEITFKKAYAIGIQDAKNQVIMQCNSRLPLRIDGYEFWCREVR